MLFIWEFWYLLKKTAFSYFKSFKFCIVSAVDSRLSDRPNPHNTQHSLLEYFKVRNELLLLDMDYCDRKLLHSVFSLV